MTASTTILKNGATESTPATIYYATWCPFCQRLITALDAERTPYILIDADQDEQGSEWVKSVNDGNRIVPTIKYSDGTHATNPPAADVIAKIAELS